MTQDERLKDILEYLKQYGKIHMEDICKRYKVSRDTARRDLVKLNDTKLIVRVQGGAMLSTFASQVPHYEQRFADRDIKRKIGQTAAALVKDNDYLFMDASTTVQLTAESLSAHNLVVVTNSIDVAIILGKKGGMKIHLLGGEFDFWNRSVTGVEAMEMLRNYHVQTLFVGACGFTLDGLSSPIVEEAYLKREMIRRAERVVVLADCSKFTKVFFHHICGLEEIDVLITDKEPPEYLKDALTQYNIECLIAMGGEHNDD
jgi:DeoR/GlpR family transcriptional regulator of sugar metabolism